MEAPTFINVVVTEAVEVLDIDLYFQSYILYIAHDVMICINIFSVISVVYISFQLSAMDKHIVPYLV